MYVYQSPHRYWIGRLAGVAVCVFESTATKRWEKKQACAARYIVFDRGHLAAVHCGINFRVKNTTPNK